MAGRCSLHHWFVASEGHHEFGCRYFIYEDCDAERNGGDGTDSVGGPFGWRLGWCASRRDADKRTDHDICAQGRRCRIGGSIHLAMGAGPLRHAISDRHRHDRGDGASVTRKIGHV